MEHDVPPAALKGCAEIRLPHFDDGADGFLTIAEQSGAIPFPVRRVYWISRLGNPEAVRGRHAHRTLHQALFCAGGSFRLDLDDGTARSSVVLDRPNQGVYLGPGLWHTMRHFSADCVILVLASAPYDEADYLRDYAAFRAFVSESKT
jgi:hypothetical protein